MSSNAAVPEALKKFSSHLTFPPPDPNIYPVPIRQVRIEDDHQTTILASRFYSFAGGAPPRGALPPAALRSDSCL